MYRYIRPSRNEQIWSVQKQKLLVLFNELTEKDLYFEAGRKYEMIDRIGVKLGKTEIEMKEIFHELDSPVFLKESMR